jgi:prephenate dehydrogenase
MAGIVGMGDLGQSIARVLRAHVRSRASRARLAVTARQENSSTGLVCH